MAYKLLGLIVWRRRVMRFRRKLHRLKRLAAIATLAALVIGGVLAAQRRPPSE